MLLFVLVVAFHLKEVTSKGKRSFWKLHRFLLCLVFMV